MGGTILDMILESGVQPHRVSTGLSKGLKYYAEGCFN